MVVILSRSYGIKQTQGQLVVLDEDNLLFSCKTLELPYLENKKDISCIPASSYGCVRIHSTKHGDCFQVLGVPNRDGILIHRGNFASERQVDTQGCILAGMHFQDINGDGNQDVADSTLAMNMLLTVLPKTFKLHIL